MPTEKEWDYFVQADNHVNGWQSRPTKSSAMKLAQHLANECEHEMEIYWKKGRRAWRNCLTCLPYNNKDNHE